MTRLIDVSHTVEEGLVTYPGLPAPLVCDFLSREASRALYAEGTTFQIARVGMVVDATGRGRSLDAGLFDGLALRGKAVLVRTGWDEHWATPAYFHGHPFL